MLSLYRLLFSRWYWRRISLRAHWREARLSLLRAHKDKRARKFLLLLFLLLLLPFICVFYLVWFVTSGAIFLAPLIIPAILWTSRSRKRNQPLHIAPKPELHSVAIDKDRQAIRDYLCEMCILYAVMLDRASSESFLHEKELPPNTEVISRRTHIDLLRRTGIWDKMAAYDREVMMIPDGHWEPELIARTNTGMEPLRLLRWVLRIDFFLSAVGLDPGPSYAVAREIVASPPKMFGAKKLIGWDSLYIARNSAEQYFYRCAAESISRGCHETADEMAQTWAGDVSLALAGKQDEDLLLGARLVSEASSIEVSRALVLAQTRMNFLVWIEALLSGTALPLLPFSFPMEPEAVYTP